MPSQYLVIPPHKTDTSFCTRQVTHFTSSHTFIPPTPCKLFISDSLLTFS